MGQFVFIFGPSKLFCFIPEVNFDDAIRLCFWKKYPRSRITGLSNSATQKEHIDAVAKDRGLLNVEVYLFVHAENRVE